MPKEQQLTFWENGRAFSKQKPAVEAPPPDLDPLKPSKVYDTYWYFAAERQNIFYRKIKSPTPPYTDDPILADYKFTNAYRASDRASQYLIKNVIYSSEWNEKDLLFRILLFKTFNRISTWELLSTELGPLTWSRYSFKAYNEVLERAMKKGDSIYSGAYMMASGKSAFGHRRKHQNHLKLIESMVEDELPARIQFSDSMQEVFDLFKSYQTIGDFLAYQYATDINYSKLTDFSEKEFVVPGPGARDGIEKCFDDLGGLSEPEVIKLMMERQDKEFERLGIDFKNLWGRPLQLIDCQNLFCEVDKYARKAHPDVAGQSGRSQIKQKYTPTEDPIRYWYPPEWGINDRVESYLEEHSPYHG
jgi:hypothetical protein